MKIGLILKSKNQKSLLKTILFVNYYFKPFLLNQIKSVINFKIKKQNIVLLSSPHVHKLSQNKFYSKRFKTKYVLFFKNFFKLNLVLKKMNKNLFHDINFIIKFQLFKNFKINNYITFFVFKIKNIYYHNLFVKNNLIRKDYLNKILKIFKISRIVK